MSKSTRPMPSFCKSYKLAEVTRSGPFWLTKRILIYCVNKQNAHIQKYTIKKGKKDENN